MRLIVGCPVYKRDWIIPWWFAYIEMACERAEIEPSYAFVLDPDDHDTHTSILRQTALHDRIVQLRYVKQPSREDVRHWSLERFAQMAAFRNELLGAVREAAPDVFLSIDSDILLNPRALVRGLEVLGQYDAVGTKTYLANGTRITNYAMLSHGESLRREDADGLMRVDVLMAIKLMSPAAYAVDYVAHKMGEDIGWSINCKNAGVTLGWDGADPSKHVMKREELNVIDQRCGY